MRDSFRRNFDDAQKDDFYTVGIAARRSGQKTFKSTKGFLNVRDALSSTEETASIDLAPALGSVRLRHTSTSQPLVADDSAFDFSLPFEKNAVLLEQLWNYLLKLEDLSRQEDQRRKINDFFRVIVHSLQFDIATDAITPVDPARHQRLAYFLNDHKGQGFISRFMEIMPPSYLRKLYFASFVVFHDLVIDPRSQFASNFVRKLASYMLENVKPKWLAAFLRQGTGRGFLGIATDPFRSCCIAILLRTVVARLPGLDEGNSQLLKSAVSVVIEKIVTDLQAVLQADYNLLFMRAIFVSVLKLVPDSPLKTLICAASI
jgi:hypothetical protein